MANDFQINRRRWLAGALAGAATAAPARVLAQDSGQGSEYAARNRPTSEVFAAFSGAGPRGYPAFVKETYDADLIVRFRLESVDLEVFLFRLSDSSKLQSFISAEAAQPNIVQIGPNQTFQTQTDETYSLRARSLQYALDLAGIESISPSNGGEGVRVAVIDSAIDRSHPALNGRVVAAFDIIGVRPDIRPMRRLDAMRHGTAVAGIIAASGKLRGVAPNAELIAIEAFTQPGGKRKKGNVSSSATIAHSIDAALTLDCDIINMSFGGPKDSLVALMIEEALSRNVLVVAASGNRSAGRQPPFPASHPAVLAVTAVDKTGKLSADAITGPHTRIAAPGVDILTTAPKGGFQIVSGTSMSAPHVTGLAAIARSQNPALTPHELRQWLYETGDAVPAASGNATIRLINGARFMNRVFRSKPS